MERLSLSGELFNQFIPWFVLIKKQPQQILKETKFQSIENDASWQHQVKVAESLQHIREIHYLERRTFF